MTSVEIADQYVSGNRKTRATSKEATAATAVRTEWINIGHPAQVTKMSVGDSFVVLNRILSRSPKETPFRPART